MAAKPEIVVTGLGVVSPIGIGRQSFWRALQGRISGVRPLVGFDASQMPVRFGGQLVDFDAKTYVKPRKALKVMCRELQTAVAAAALAVEDAGLAATDLNPDRIGTLYGSEMLYGEPDEFTDLYRACQVDGRFDASIYGDKFVGRMYPLWMLKNLPNMAACHVAIMIDARGPNNTIVSGEASSLLALLEAVRVMERGHADVMSVGGTGSRVGLTGWLYRGCNELSHRNDNPAAASRPFDEQRDGLVNGEGAATIVLETREHATARGATILAQVSGIGTGMATQRDEAGFARAISQSLRQCLTHADMSPNEIGHVNAHAMSSIEMDRAEAKAIAAVLDQTPVTALKSYFGNLGTGSSLVELIGSILALEYHEVPATLNYETPDPRCPVNVIRDNGLTNAKPSAVKIAYSGMGQTAAVLLKK